ncbi:hypothetical protein M413DRAFT_447825 [Hebeloma cylindrosporum]|uniref:Uncharacterized protein n=1 Tax=Hebeloma cylindrosporum TaxID=76867 RepID=A0A0C2XKN4_HEBCY|nr:hypothetical protein M413DRAFT_447825 [Hebeloma cylindrosporum h7]
MLQIVLLISKKQFAWFSVSYCPESRGNLATSFKLISAEFVNNPPAGTPMAASFAAFRPLADQSDEEDQGKPGYQGLLICVYTVNDRTADRLTALPMYEDYLRPWTKPDEWFGPLKYMLDKGLVFRLISEESEWKPGMMKREGSKWVWKEKSVEELRKHDIHLSRAPL